MPALEPASSSVGACSTSSSIPTARVTDAFESEVIPLLRESVRGMEAQLVDLVFQSSPPGQLMDWLKMPLGCAATAGNLAAVKRLLAAGVKTETPPQSAPLLHLAAESGNEGVVEELLQAGVDVHEKDSSRENRTALHCAAAAGGDAVVGALTSAGASIGVLDARGRTPLHHACMYGHRGVVVFLLLKGARAQKKSKEQEPPLHLAAIHNHPGVIEDLLSFGNVSIERYDMEGQSALHVAAQYGRVEACVALLRGGAAAGRSTRSNGKTCLDVAASEGHTGQLLQVLTTAEATDSRKRMCSRALWHATVANEPETIRDLVALGADMAYRRKPGQVPSLHAAVLYRADRAVEALLQAGANVDARFNGDTPLHFACTNNLPSMVQLLLRWGADEYAEDSNDEFPSDIIGIDAPTPGPEPHSEFVIDERLADCIRSMLETAPADRSWRRRGWLVICRARWLARVVEREKRSSAPLECIPDGATGGGKKRRGTTRGSALVGKPRGYLSLDKGKAYGRNEGRGRHLPEATAAATAAAVLRLGICSVLSDGGAGQAAGVEGHDGRTRSAAVVEQLLLLREDSIFREIVTFL